MPLKYKCHVCGIPLGFDGLCWKCRAKQEREGVLAWTAEEIEAKLRRILAHPARLDSWETQESKDACKLQEFRGICPPALQRAAAKAGVTCLEQIYYHAPEDVRDILIERLTAAKEPHEAGKLMCCLAMQGDDRALAALLELERNPRPWRAKLYVDPSIYAQCGGWTFDREGVRRALNFEACYAMEKSESPKGSAAVIGRTRTDVCPHCSSPLTDILVLDGRDERLGFLGLDGIFTATCCPSCCAFSETVFSRFTLDGGSVPLFPYQDLQAMENYVGEEGLAELASNAYALGKSPVPLFYGAGSEDLNTIGGFANWVQDWQYVPCPDCGKPMRYLAQIQWDTVMEGMEGTLYIELCPDCRVAAMHHQQT